MKKTFIAATLLMATVSGYSQGQITFNNFATGFHQAIYNSSAPNTLVEYNGYFAEERQGSSATDTPAGTTVYSGAPLGGSTATGSLYMVQLLAAPSFNQPLDSLVPVGTPKTFQTTAAGAGYASAGQNVIVNPTGTQATIAIAAWSTGGGQYTTLAAAQAAHEVWGISELANITGGIPPNVPSSMSTASNLNLSFSLRVIIPEPSTITLGVMGASTLLFRRRK